jgi:SAM-dependent methyltransferase
MNVRADKRQLWLEPISCPLCRASDTRPWGCENGYDAGKCNSCGLVYVNPRPTMAHITEANKIGQHRTDSGSIDVAYRPSRRKELYHRNVVQQLFDEELRSGKAISWLDVGAGYGELMHALAGLLPSGSKIHGVEPMETKARYARNRGFLLSGTLKDISTQYDVVSLMNVFSHIPDFDRFLTELKHVMRKDSTILLETGNGGDLDTSDQYPDKLYLPDHLVFGGLSHVESYLKRNGFELMSVKTSRVDTLSWALKCVVKRSLGRDAKVVIPYTSPFRTVYFKARYLGEH